MTKALLLGQKIDAGFYNDVYLHQDGQTVIKIPKNTSYIINQTKKNMDLALQLHQEYFGTHLPKTNIKRSTIGPIGYIIEQEYIEGPKAKSSDLEQNKNQREDIIYRGMQMEKKHGLYFDIYSIGEYIPNIAQLLKQKDCTIGNILIDDKSKLHYIDVGYLKTDTLIGLLCVHARDIMMNIMQGR